jgi:hypothetical protein
MLKINAEYNTIFFTRINSYKYLTDAINKHMTVAPVYIYEQYEDNEYLIDTNKDFIICIEYGSFNYSTYYSLEETLDKLEQSCVITYSLKNLFLNFVRKFPDKIPLIKLPCVKVLLCPRPITDLLTANRIPVNVLQCDLIYDKIMSKIELRTMEQIIIKQNKAIVLLVVILIIMGYLLLF